MNEILDVDLGRGGFIACEGHGDCVYLSVGCVYLSVGDGSVDPSNGVFMTRCEAQLLRDRLTEWLDSGIGDTADDAVAAAFDEGYSNIDGWGE